MFKLFLIPFILLHGIWKAGDISPDLQKHRPFQRTGKIRIDDPRFLGKSWDYGSGGHGRGSVPLGSDKLGHLSKSPKYKFQKFDVGDGGKVFDPKLGTYRYNIELHPLKNWKGSLGCVSVPKDQFAELKDIIQQLQDEWGDVYINRLPTGNITLSREPVFLPNGLKREPLDQIRTDFPLNIAYG